MLGTLVGSLALDLGGHRGPGDGEEFIREYRAARVHNHPPDQIDSSPS
jgi:hypothetical protein